MKTKKLLALLLTLVMLVGMLPTIALPALADGDTVEISVTKDGVTGYEAITDEITFWDLYREQSYIFQILCHLQYGAVGGADGAGEAL